MQFVLLSFHIGDYITSTLTAAGMAGSILYNIFPDSHNNEDGY